jgi:hypothetical protein
MAKNMFKLLLVLILISSIYAELIGVVISKGQNWVAQIDVENASVQLLKPLGFFPNDLYRTGTVDPDAKEYYWTQGNAKGAISYNWKSNTVQTKPLQCCTFNFVFDSTDKMIIGTSNSTDDTHIDVISVDPTSFSRSVITTYELLSSDPAEGIGNSAYLEHMGLYYVNSWFDNILYVIDVKSHQLVKSAQLTNDVICLHADNTNNILLGLTRNPQTSNLQFITIDESMNETLGASIPGTADNTIAATAYDSTHQFIYIIQLNPLALISVELSSNKVNVSKFDSSIPNIFDVQWVDFSID